MVPAMGAIYESAEQLASAIQEARKLSQMSQQELADDLGTSIGTVKRWEAGEEATLGRTPQARRSVAVQVVEVTGAPRELFGLPVLPEARRSTEQRLGVLEMQMREVVRMLEQDEGLDVEELRAAGDAVSQRYETSSVPTEAPESGAGNG
jgi:transcriptional regulator with XRE-family HTH domain